MNTSKIKDLEMQKEINTINEEIGKLKILETLLDNSLQQTQRLNDPLISENFEEELVDLIENVGDQIFDLAEKIDDICAGIKE